MKKCKCEHWQTCPVCYPQGFDEAGNRKPVEIPPTRGEMLARIKELRAERDEYRTKYQINAARSDERCKQLCEMESERDALKAENIALISPGLKNEAERGNDGFLMTKIADLVQERDALAITVQQMRNAMLYVMRATVLSMDAAPDSPTGRIYETANHAYELPDNAAEIIKRHDAAVLRKAAEHLHAKARAYLNEFDRRVAHDMASALEKSCPPSN